MQIFRPSLNIVLLSGRSTIEDRYNNKINYLHKRMLRIVYKDYKSSFAEPLSEDKSFTVHHKKFKS